MNAYAKTAVEAAKQCCRSSAPDPVAAWNQKVRIYLLTVEGQKKSCPKSTFLGLCEEGLVAGVPRGRYTRSTSNKMYALRAVDLLFRQPSLTKDAATLWRIVMAGVEKQPNSQMDVVIALWNADLITKRG